jgi:hypothetical protein
MAGDANSPRLGTARLLQQEVAALKLTCGILVKTTRAYKRPGKPTGLRQPDCKALSQAALSNLELGKSIPGDPKLASILTEVGFDPGLASTQALLALMQFLRDHAKDIKALEDDEPV